MVVKRKKAASVRDDDSTSYSNDVNYDSEATDPNYAPVDLEVESHPPINARGTKTKRKGRPVTFQEEDIDWDTLSPEERRKIRRRLSNRASAHRVRQRRLEMMDTLQSKIKVLHQQQGVMIARMQAGEEAQQQLRAELAVARERWASTAQDNMRLHAENTMMRRLLTEAKIPIPEHAPLDVSDMGTLQPNALEALSAQGHTTDPKATDPLKHVDDSDSKTTPAAVLFPLTPLPSGFASVQPPVSLAPAQPPTSPPALLTRSLLSEQLVSQFTVDLNRAFTLSFNMDQIEGAPSLGLNALIDMGMLGNTTVL